MRRRKVIVCGLDACGEKTEETLSIIEYNWLERFFRWIFRKRHTLTLTTNGRQFDMER